MTRADNSRLLAQAAAKRRAATHRRAKTAIAALDRSGRAVTFCSVAEAAGVSRAWLYRQPDIRDAIISLRAARSDVAPSTPLAQHTSTASLRQRLDTSRAEITSLRAENAQLREQLARRLGEQRARHRPEPINEG